MVNIKFCWTLKYMENPATWTDEVKALSESIAEALREIDNGVIGLSLPQSVYNKLMERGFKVVKIDKTNE